VQVEVTQQAPTVVELGEQREQLRDDIRSETARSDAVGDARHEVGQAGHDPAVQRRVHLGPREREPLEASRVGAGDHLAQHRAVDAFEDEAVTLTHHHPLVRARRRNTRGRDHRERGGLHRNEAVPLGPIKLQHAAVVPREHFGCTARRNQLHRGRA
jgi:hypothetical protein